MIRAGSASADFLQCPGKPGRKFVQHSDRSKGAFPEMTSTGCAAAGGCVFCSNALPLSLRGYLCPWQSPAPQNISKSHQLTSHIQNILCESDDAAFCCPAGDSHGRYRSLGMTSTVVRCKTAPRPGGHPGTGVPTNNSATSIKIKFQFVALSVRC